MKKKGKSPWLSFPYLTYFPFIHNYSRVIFSQDIHIPDLQWHWWFVGDIIAGAEQHHFAWSMKQISVLFLNVSMSSLGPRYCSIPQASCCCMCWSEYLNESLNSSSSASSDQHRCQALSQASSMWVKHRHWAPSAENGRPEGNRGQAKRPLAVEYKKAYYV